MRFSQYYAPVFIIMAVALQQYATWCGIGFTHDSYQYLAAAKSYAADYRFLNATGDPYTAFPPLFPVVLSFFDNNIVKTAPLFHGFVLAASLYVFHIIGEKVIESRKVNILYFASLALGTPVMLIHCFFWSEPFFLFLLALKVLILFKFLDSAKFRYVFFLGLLGFLLCLQRNAGVFFIAGITLSLLFLGKHPYKKLYGLYYLLVSLSGFSLWNYYAANTAGRNLNPFNHPFFTGFLENNLNYFDKIGTWFLPLPLPITLKIVLLIVLICISSGVLFLTHRHWSFSKTRKVKALLILPVVYLAGLFTVTGPYPFESERLLAVVYPMVMLVLFSVLDNVKQVHLPKKYYRILFIVAAIWLFYPAVRTIKNVHQWHKVFCQAASSKTLTG